MTTALSFRAAAAEHPERVALVDGGRALRFGELAAEVARAADRLAASDQPLAIVAAPTRAALVDAWAALELGRALVPLHPRLPDADHAEQRALAAIAVREPGERPLAILFTSGTSGRPRGVVLPARALVAAAEASARLLGWRDDDRWWLALPWAHVGGLSIVTRCLAARRAIVLGGEHATLDRDRVTLASLVPTQLARAIASGPPPPTLRAVLVGGAAAPPALLADARARGWPALATYGLTEACSQVATQRAPGDPGCGRPLAGVDVRIASDGAIELRGPTLLARYVGGAPHDERAWFRTSDLGALDAGGHLHVRGRADDVIVTGGEKVMPDEVEAALLAEPALGDACVFGVADALWGQLVAAAIVAASTEAAALAALARVAQRLAPHKRPRRYALVAELPATAIGKRSRARVREACAARLAPV